MVDLLSGELRVVTETGESELGEQAHGALL
jgi:hypothetical protein